MARWAGELERSASGWEDKPEGKVRIATPPGFAYDFLTPFAAELKERAPGITLELLAGIEHLDLSRGQAELAVRTKKPAQPDLEAVLGMRSKVGVFATERYVARLRAELAQPHGPFALKDIAWVGWAPPYEHLEPTPTLQRLIPGFAPAFSSNDYIVQLRATALGLGAMILPQATHRYAQTPGLEEMPVGFELPCFEMYVVCAKTMRWVPRVQRVLEELRLVLAQMQRAELLEPGTG
jgi:DNA-binding transcriptional LysR family regulator